MNRLITQRQISLSALTPLLFFLTSPACAGASTAGQLVYGPQALAPTAVPTISATMLIVMSLLLATIGYRVMRNKSHQTSRMMVLTVIATGMLASGAGEVKLIIVPCIHRLLHNNAYLNYDNSFI